MSLEGHSPKSRKESAPPVPQTEEQARFVLENLAQIAEAGRRFREAHPDIENPDGNEVMLEFISTGAAEDFRRVVGSMDEEALRATIQEVRRRNDETIH